MENTSRPPDYHRNLPHYAPNDAPYFVTFNLDGALPCEARERLLSDNSKFRDFDAYLEGHSGTELVIIRPNRRDPETSDDAIE